MNNSSVDGRKAYVYMELTFPAHTIPMNEPITSEHGHIFHISEPLLVALNIPYNMPVTRSFDISFFVSMNKLLYQWYSFVRIKTPGRSCNVDFIELKCLIISYFLC